MRKRNLYVMIILLVVFIIGVVGQQFDDFYLAKKINVNGLELFMKEKEVTELFGEEDPEESYCMGCGPDMNYKKLGLFARLSETKHYIKSIKITNSTYDLLSIKPNQKISTAQKLLKDMGFTIVEKDHRRQVYQKKRLIFRLFIDQGIITSAQVEYQVKKDNNIIY
ncbi:hypothetical protein [Bacillus sp. FJAT-29814]|uniref:hypothetical protein n=1 Tax=Bacillus sp. FJAT-29814 TaxID=1729688 RepID=UPI00082DC8E9|nr:hypothetical protein [Bacillus sp. FJAT-29814]